MIDYIIPTEEEEEKKEISYFLHKNCHTKQASNKNPSIKINFLSPSRKIEFYCYPNFFFIKIHDSE